MNYVSFRSARVLAFGLILTLGSASCPTAAVGQTGMNGLSDSVRVSPASSSTEDAAAPDTTESYEPYGNPMPFSGWKVINLPTDRTVPAGNWLFLISHRFGQPVGEGYSAFYGLDGPATMYLSLGYAVTDNLLVALARSNVDDNVELETRYGLLAEGGDGPVGVSLQGSMNWLTEDRPNQSRWRSAAFKFTGQVTLTRTVADQLGLALVPGLTLNPDELQNGEAPLISLGLGARWRVQEKVAFVAEWTPILSRSDRTVADNNRYATWSGGVEITTGGHVFQLVVSNNTGLATDQYLGGGDLAFRNVYEGDFRLGFNIFRILDFSKF